VGPSLLVWPALVATSRCRVRNGTTTAPFMGFALGVRRWAPTGIGFRFDLGPTTRFFENHQYRGPVVRPVVLPGVHPFLDGSVCQQGKRVITSALQVFFPGNMGFEFRYRPLGIWCHPGVAGSGPRKKKISPPKAHPGGATGESEQKKNLRWGRPQATKPGTWDKARGRGGGGDGKKLAAGNSVPRQKKNAPHRRSRIRGKR